jgi:hypothetical protein
MLAMHITLEDVAEQDGTAKLHLAQLQALRPLSAAGSQSWYLSVQLRPSTVQLVPAPLDGQPALLAMEEIVVQADGNAELQVARRFLQL